MITGISGSSSYSSYVSSSSTTSATSNSKKFADDLLKKLDTNGDGSIDKDELSSALTSDSKDGITVSLSKAFTDLDSNDDDGLDADELAAMTPPPPPMQMDSGSAADEAQDLLSALDTDGDGNVSSDELTAALSSSDSSADSSQVFDALDTNQDGTVSLDELTASLQAQQPPPPPAQDSSDLFSSLDSDGDGSITADELSAALTPDSSNQQQTTTQATEALNRMVAALSDRYNLNNSATSGKYVSTSA